MSLKRMMLGSTGRYGVFVLSASFNTAFTSLSGTNVPTFLLPTGTNANYNAYFINTIPSQTITVGITTPPITIRLDLVVNGVLKDSSVGITTSGTYGLVLPLNVLPGDNIQIQINT
jgi:hypothetical protein